MVGIREPAAPYLLLWDAEKQWVLSPENRQLYSLGNSWVQKDGGEQLSGIQYAEQVSPKGLVLGQLLFIIIITSLLAKSHKNIFFPCLCANLFIHTTNLICRFEVFTLCRYQENHGIFNTPLQIVSGQKMLSGCMFF